MQGFTVGNALSRGFSAFSANFLPFYVLTAIVQAPGVVLTYMFQVDQATLQRDPFRAFSVLGVALIPAFLLHPIATATVTYGVFQQLRGKKASFGDCLSVGLQRMFPVLGVAIVAGILTMLGSLACLIPGLILMCGYYLAVPSAVVERLGVGESLTRSWSLTRGHRGAIFLIFLALGLLGAGVTLILRQPFKEAGGTLSLAGTLVTSAVGIVLQALGSATNAVVYHDIRVAKEGVSSEDLASVFD